MPVGDATLHVTLPQEIGLVVVLITPDSALAGRTLSPLRARGELHLTILGLRRGREVVREEHVSSPATRSR